MKLAHREKTLKSGEILTYYINVIFSSLFLEGIKRKKVKKKRKKTIKERKKKKKERKIEQE